MSSTPTEYERQANFTSYESSYPTQPKSGADLDAEFNAVKTALDETQSRLAKIQREDGGLANGVVTMDSLDEDLQGAIEAVQGDVAAVNNARDAAQASAVSASNSANIATGGATSATNSAVTAGASAVAASNSASAAEDSASSAAASLAAMQEAGGVSTGMLADEAVTTAKIEDGAVTTDKIAGEAVDYTKVAPGMVIGFSYASYAANADFSGTIANDDTIPQNTEGSEIVTLAYTVKDADNLLRVRFTGFAVSGTAAIDYTVALFRDGQADAIAVWNSNQTNNANYRTPLMLDCVFAPGAAGAITLSIRVGNQAGNTFRLNGSTAGRLWGGKAAAWLIVEEIKA